MNQQKTLDEINDTRTDKVLTPSSLAKEILKDSDLLSGDNNVWELTQSKLKSNVIQSENKSTVFGDIGFGGSDGQARLFDSINHEKDELFEDRPLIDPNGLSISQRLIESAFEKSDTRNLKDIQVADTISMYVSTFAKICSRHLAENSLRKLINGKMAGVKYESEEIDIWTNDGESVQVLTSSAKEPKSASKKIDNPENVDKYVVIHFKNDGSAGVGVEDVPDDGNYPYGKGAHITARDT